MFHCIFQQPVTGYTSNFLKQKHQKCTQCGNMGTEYFLLWQTRLGTLSPPYPALPNLAAAVLQICCSTATSPLQVLSPQGFHGLPSSITLWTCFLHKWESNTFVISRWNAIWPRGCKKKKSDVTHSCCCCWHPSVWPQVELIWVNRNSAKEALASFPFFLGPISGQRYVSTCANVARNQETGQEVQAAL